MEQALQTMINNMPEKTGKSLLEWKKILKAKNFEKHGQAMKFLKEEHKVTHGFANTIIQLSKENSDSDEVLISQQYDGKDHLFEIYQLLCKKISSFGDDIIITPKKDSVSFIRKRQFTLIKPATKSRIDLGLKLPGKDHTQRLQNSGPFGAMCTHRVTLESLSEVDDELVNWIQEAYKKAI